MISVCSKCRSKNTRMVRAKGLWQHLTTLLGFYTIHCKDCGARQKIPFYGISIYARCPNCLREDLSDWAEPYRFPPRYQRWLRNFGAKGHRCSPCRINFVSFRPRREDYVPSWRQHGRNERAATPPERKPQEPIRSH
ncbi:MAG: hypothetical protein R2762_05170 [Bryobacteraceae bacterium]